MKKVLKWSADGEDIDATITLPHRSRRWRIGACVVVATQALLFAGLIRSAAAAGEITDLSVQIDLVGGQTPTAGAPLNATALVRNVGPDIARGATVTIAVPPPWALIGGPSIDAIALSCTPGATPSQHVCALPDLSSNDLVDIALTVRPATSGTFTLGATVAVAAGTTDPNTANNTDQTPSITPYTPPADLRTAITRDVADVIVGQPVVITSTITNDGPNAAPSVVLTGVAPSLDGSAPAVLVASQGTCTTPDAVGAFTCQIGTVADAGSATVQATFTPQSGGASLPVSADAQSSATADPDPRNNLATDLVAVGGQYAALQLLMAPAPSTVNLDRTATAAVTVTSAGTVPADATRLELQLPPGATFVAVGSYDNPDALLPCVPFGQTVVCDLGTLPVYDPIAQPAGRRQLYVRFDTDTAVALGGTWTVDASVTTEAFGDALVDNAASTTITVIADSASLDAPQLSAPPEPDEAGLIEYSVIVTQNHGGGTATGTSFDLDLAPGVVFEDVTFFVSGAAHGARSCAVSDAALNVVTCQLGDLGGTGTIASVEAAVLTRVDLTVNGPGAVLPASVVVRAAQAAPQSAGPVTTIVPGAVAGPVISYSSSPSRTPASPADGAVVSGRVAMFLTDGPTATPTSRTASSTIRSVRFRVISSTGKVVYQRHEGSAPFDLGGTERGKSGLVDTGRWGNGAYRLEATVTPVSGAPYVVTSSFTVDNVRGPNVLRWSTSPNRSNPAPLAGATIKQKAAIFLDTNPFVVSKVRFYVDKSKHPKATETIPAYDFGGTAGANPGKAQLVNLVHALGKGKHTIRALISYRDGTTAEVSATFTVA